MDFKWLDDFMSLRELGNFGAAAKARHVTQSAFSRRIQALELWVGTPLFDRTSYPITLTEHGEKFVPYVENLLEQIKVTKEDFAQVSLKTDNTVRIVSLHSFAVNLLPNLFRQGSGQFKTLNLAINPSVQGIDNHFQALLDGSSDILFAYNTQGMRPSFLIEDKVEKLLVSQEEIIPVISPRLLEQHASGEDYPYLAYSEHTFLHNVVAPLVDKSRCPLNQVFETTLTESLIKMAVNGYGVAWAPRHAIDAELSAGLLVRAFPEMTELLITLDIVCYRAKEANRQSVSQFWRGLSQVVDL
ncbi:LysR substrate-binding domain-containing protein (plasmid) [Photobacterium sp. DA100]|uniref:LysR family transcriptional regulator n=1 Tax=Photobacterium sp. DA100 TaxID=3027472 RepID=UPI002479C203|nr:LysR family transcriptional regulator [Photobacterium sp. DA100]WEM45305.1 LysR substrate-binding domain-containing protein [Photobacterium sp. DA100]